MDGQPDKQPLSRERHALGKGLGALFSSLPATGEVQQLDVRRLIPNRHQPRQHFDDISLKELAESIRKQGVVQPVLVRRNPQGGYELIAGERRWRAAQLAGLNTIPAMIKEVSDAEMLQLALIENLQRQDLNPLEAARGYQRLTKQFELTQDEVAATVGKERSTVANYLRLLTLPDAVKSALAEGALTFGHAKAILTISQPAAQHQLAQRIVDEGLSVRQAESAARTLSGRRRRLLRPTEFADLEERLRQRMGTRVSLKGRTTKGRIVLHFFSREELERLLDLLGVSASA
jgi:ParB family chromosome partitioning protein